MVDVHVDVLYVSWLSYNTRHVLIYVHYNSMYSYVHT